MAATTYQNFDLLITSSGDDYRAFVVDAPGGDADSVFALPFTTDELDFLGNLAGVRRGGTGTGGVGSVSDLKELGGLLYGAVIQGKVAAVLATSLEKAEQDNIGLRLRLRFSEETSELAALPWEILYDPVQERFLALSEASPILRYLSLPKARPTLLVKPPLRVLTVLASPPGYEELEIEREWQVLESALAGLVADGKFVLDRLESPTFSALQERLLREDIHILHFVGHGVYDDETGTGALVLADGEGEAQEVGGEELATLLHNHRSLRLVYLNACEGALSSHLSVFSGVAQTLVQQGVPAAVAMQAEISDEAAIDLSRLFYSALAAGYPVDAALTQARVAIAARSAEWAIPVLFSRSPDNRLFDVVEVLPAPDCPYPGMKPFNEEQKEFFFGRDKAIDDAVNRLAKHPFLAVVGPSGSGKSSLVYAGILPALRKSHRFGPGPWTVYTLRPSDARTADGKAAPMQALSQLGDLSTQSPVPNPQSPIPNPQSPVPSPQSPILLFIDQFEETFTLADAAEARAFLDALHALIGEPNLYILLTVRADFYAEMMAMGDLWADVQARRLELTPLGEDELWAAIVEPAARVGVDVEDALATALIADARGEAGVLPLVQETLVRLWDKVEGRQLKRSAYRQMAEGGRSGIQVAINDHANDIYHTLPAADRSIARRIFLRLIQFGEGRADTRRQQTVAELRAGGDDTVRFDEMLRALVDGRLLTSSGEEGDPNRRVDISHEALIGGWALLQGWINEKRVAESTRRRLEEKVAEWERLERSGGLLDEYEVQEAEQWLSTDDARELGASAELRDLIQQSRRSLRQAQIMRYGGAATIAGLLILALAAFSFFQNRTIDLQNVNATEQAQSAARIAAAATAEATALVALEAALDTTIQARATAEAETRRNLSERLAALARVEIERYGAVDDQTLILAQDAVLSTLTQDGYVTANADSVLRSAVHLAGQHRPLPQSRRTQHTAFVQSARFSHDDSEIISISREDNSVRIWDSMTGELTRKLTIPGLSDAVFLGDGSEILTASLADKLIIHVWDRDGNIARETSIPKIENLVLVGFPTLDGKTLLAVSRSEEKLVLYIWSITLEDLNYSETARIDRVSSISQFGPYLGIAQNEWQDLLIYETGTHRLSKFHKPLSFNTLLDVGTTQPISDTFLGVPISLVSKPPQVSQWLVYEDGNAIALAFDNGFVVLWNLTSSEEIWRTQTNMMMAAPGYLGGSTALAISRVGSLLAVSSYSGLIKVWKIGNQEPLQFSGHADILGSLAFSNSGQFLVSASRDMTIRVWDLVREQPHPNWVPEGHIAPIVSLSFDPRGKLLISADLQKVVSLWDMATGARINRLEFESINPNQGVGYSGPPDGLKVWFGVQESTAMILSPKGELYVWDWTASTTTKRSQTEKILFVHNAVMSPDRRYIVAAVRVRAGNESAGVDALVLWDLQNDATPILSELQIDLSDAVITIDRSSRYVAVASRLEIQVLDLATLQSERILQYDPEGLSYNHVTSLAFSPDSESIAVSFSYKEIVLWHVQTGEVVVELEDSSEDINRGYTTVIFSPDGRLLLSGGYDQTARLWNIDAGEVVARTTGYPLIYSGDGRQIIGKNLELNGGPRGFVIWDGNTLQVEKLIESQEQMTDVVTSDSAQTTMAIGTENGSIHVVALAYPEPLRALPGNAGTVYTAALNQEEDLVALASNYLPRDDDQIQIWDIQQDTLLKLAPGSLWLSIALSPVDNHLAAADSNGIQIWDLDARRILWTDEGEMNRSLSYSPDGKLISSGDKDGTVTVWDAGIGTIVWTDQNHEGWVSGTQFSPDGTLLASAGGQTIALWNAKSGRLWKEYRHDARVGCAYNSISFDDNASLLAVCAENGRVLVWDIASENGATFEHNSNHTTAVAISGNGRYLASSGRSGILIRDLVSGLTRVITEHSAEVVHIEFDATGTELWSVDSNGRVGKWIVDIENLIETSRLYLQRTTPALTEQERISFGLE